MTRLARALAGAAPIVLIAAAASAQQPATNTLPQPTAIPSQIPAPKDVAYPGTIALNVDATDVARGIVSVTETIPVAASGPLVLLYPKWIPGTHSPTGPIDKIAGISFTAGGKTLTWTRDVVDVYAFRLDVPAGATSVTAAFKYVSPTADAQGSVRMTPDMLNIEWNTVSLYPAGYFVRDIPVRASIAYPAGWTSATALIPGLSGDRVDYPMVDYETLVDSPALAARNMTSAELAPGVRLDIAADRPDQLAYTPAQLAPHRKLIEQATRLFGAQHYDHYDFLLWLSDTMGGEGLEHHRSSEDGTGAGYFTDWDNTVTDRNLVAHEYTHSWDGKFRRPADLWTPTYNEPMGDTLLWVYEGQTQYWGYVLQARSGLATRQEVLDALAGTAAYYQNAPARAWRSVEDTTNDPTMSQRAPQPWRNYQWSEDYYEAGKLMWLDADQLIRERTGGRKSLDDFARAFFGMRDRDWGTLTYGFDDVAATLDRVTPYDWAGFLRDHMYAVQPKASLDWIARGGYRLVYVDKPTTWWKSAESHREATDLSYSLGLAISAKAGAVGNVTAVSWGGPAFQAGLTVGTRIVAVDGRSYDKDLLLATITAARGGTAPIRLLVRQNDQYRTVDLKWNDGLRYPHLEKVGKGESGLDKLLAPKT